MAKKKIRKQSLLKRHRRLSYAAAGLVLVVVAIAVYALLHKSPKTSQTAANSPSSSKIDYSPGTAADNATNNSRKGSSNLSSTLNNYQPPSNTGSYSVTITRAGLDSAKQNLQVAAIIRGATEGTCTLNVHQAGQATITRSEPISLEVNSYTCPVITIPLSQFPNQGDWNVSMTVESNGQSVTTDWAQNPVSLQ